MTKIAIVTDTNSSITQEEADKLGVHLLSMPFTVDNVEYFEGVSCTYEHFFELLEAGSEVSTSQPSPAALLDLWNELLETYDEIVHIPMSSALSSSCSTAQGLAQDYDGKVVVVDNKRISISQRTSVLDAIYLANQGLSAKEIGEKLEAESFNASIYLAVNTLELLKKSGRITAAAATIATALNLKPVLQIQGEKLDAFAKARGMKKAEKIMLEAMKKDLETRFAGKNISLCAAYSGDIEPAKIWTQHIRDYFGNQEIELYKLPISISCHVGAGVIAIAAMEVLGDYK